VAAAADWVRQGASLVHVVDLEGARTGRADRDLWRQLGEGEVPYQAGGGVRTVADVVALVAAGAERAVIGSTAVWSPATLCAMVDAVGAERLVAAIDVRSGKAHGAGWLDGGRTTADVVAAVTAAGVRDLLVTSIDRDGMLAGPDLDLLATIGAAAPGARIIGSGGVGSLDDVRDLAAAGMEAAIVGRALYEGRFTLREAMVAASEPVAPGAAHPDP